MTYNNVEFIKQKTSGNITTFTIKYDKGKNTYQVDVPLKMKTEVAPAEVEEDIQMSIDEGTPVTTMKLLQEYYGTSQQALMNAIQEADITWNKSKKVDKKPWDGEKAPNPKDYYLSAFGWELNQKDNISALNVVLRNKYNDSIQNMLYKYKKGGFNPDIPSYMNLFQIRQDIYHLRDAKQHEKANEYFRKVFKKDPLTGRDID